jgi:hypothetical protein
MFRFGLLNKLNLISQKPPCSNKGAFLWLMASLAKKIGYFSAMNIQKALLEEHSKAQSMRIVNYIGADARKFKVLMLLFLGKEYRIIQRASWVLSLCAEANPHLLDSWMKPIIYNLRRKDLHDAVRRNTLRVLQFCEIPRALQGTLTNICFGFLSDPEETIAVKVFSMTVLKNICRREPGLKNELKLVIESQLEHAGPAYLSRARKTLEALHG